ncbi:MAG: hypothetical protein AAF587_01945 [Bacteroidota bacterium]
MKHSAIPWALTVIMGLYVYGLTFYAQNRVPPEPSYDFYDTTCVSVQIHDPESLHDVYGRFNNILEGHYELIKARVEQKQYKLVFQVNSPRPAMLYIDDKALEIFLVPGDTSLKIDVHVNPVTYQFDSLIFHGKTKNICQYYLDKAVRFDQVHIRSKRGIIVSEDFESYVSKLDSMAARELAFLAEREIFSTLPDWFARFEKNEILYQKAYLKLSAAYNQDISPKLLDHIAIDNQGAVFSYYYYLYLKTYLAHQLQDQIDLSPGGDSLQLLKFTKAQLQVADSLLSGVPHDVFLTRSIFHQMTQGRTEIAEELLAQYESTFHQQKYVRFLHNQLTLHLQGI